jgi:hypothetical protein
MKPFRGADVPDYALPIVIAVGVAAINWGKLDLHLEMLLRHIDDKDYVTGGFASFPDISFRIKAQLFEKWYAKHPHFQPVHAIARPMCRGLRSANKSRVRLFHSNVEGFSPGPPPVMNIRIMKALPDGSLEISNGSWAAEDIFNFCELLAHLCDGLTKISRVVLNDTFRQSLRKA